MMCGGSGDDLMEGGPAPTSSTVATGMSILMGDGDGLIAGNTGTTGPIDGLTATSSVRTLARAPTRRSLT